MVTPRSMADTWVLFLLFSGSNAVYYMNATHTPHTGLFVLRMYIVSFFFVIIVTSNNYGNTQER